MSPASRSVINILNLDGLSNHNNIDHSLKLKHLKSIEFASNNNVPRKSTEKAEKLVGFEPESRA